MIAWVHSFRKWTWLTFAIGFAAAGWGLWSDGGHSLLVGSGLAAMIGVALIVGAAAAGDIAIASNPACGNQRARTIRDLAEAGQDGADDATASGNATSRAGRRLRPFAAFRNLSTR